MNGDGMRIFFLVEISMESKPQTGRFDVPVMEPVAGNPDYHFQYMAPNKAAFLCAKCGMRPFLNPAGSKPLILVARNNDN
jgi:hypothetical protein